MNSKMQKVDARSKLLELMPAESYIVTWLVNSRFADDVTEGAVTPEVTKAIYAAWSEALMPEELHFVGGIGTEDVVCDDLRVEHAFAEKVIKAEYSNVLVFHNEQATHLHHLDALGRLAWKLPEQLYPKIDLSGVELREETLTWAPVTRCRHLQYNPLTVLLIKKAKV
jgi:hypothetical protein